MMTIKTISTIHNNRYLSNPATGAEKLFHVLTLGGRVQDCYAAMLLRAAELGTFYASDLMDAFAEVMRGRVFWSDDKIADHYRAGAGGYMNAWAINKLIVPTGNVRESKLYLGCGNYRVVTVKEWRATFTPEQVQKVLSALYMDYIDD